MIYDKYRTQVFDYETYIYRDETEIPVNVSGEHYSGSHADDDPSEFIVDSCIVAEDNEPYKKGDKLKLTSEEENDIGERYFKTL